MYDVLRGNEDVISNKPKVEEHPFVKRGCSTGSMTRKHNSGSCGNLALWHI
jgi:hypothetical protein